MFFMNGRTSSRNAACLTPGMDMRNTQATFTLTRIIRAVYRVLGRARKIEPSKEMPGRPSPPADQRAPKRSSELQVTFWLPD
jgi:hypothetical protein